jgi:sterol 14alpha-demethylase
MSADRASTRGRRPPLVSGARPLFGHLFEFKRNPEALLRRGAKEQGPLFVLKLGPMSIYCMVGPDMNTEFFAQSDKALSISKAYRFLAEMFNPRIAIAAPPADYQHQRALVAPMLGGKRMASHFEAMVKETELWLSGLGASGRFDVVTEFERLTMYIMARAMLRETLP